MTNKFNIAILFSAILAFAYVACGNVAPVETESTSEKTSKRPNIIYIMADDMTTQAISAYGGIYKEVAPTPNIDRVANEGMLFQMSCVPMRFVGRAGQRF